MYIRYADRAAAASGGALDFGVDGPVLDDVGDSVGVVEMIELDPAGVDDFVGLLPLDEVHPATATKATSMLSPTASVLRVIDTPTTGLQGSEAGDPESQFAHFAL